MTTRRPLSSLVRRVLAGAAIVSTLALLAPSPAEAGWHHGRRGGWRPAARVYVVPAYRPARVWVAPRAYAYAYGEPIWIPAHWDRWGRWIPGHWRY